MQEIKDNLLILILNSKGQPSFTLIDAGENIIEISIDIAEPYCEIDLLPRTIC